jgi:hypothetical protein|tara:strand:- start:4244 stop:4729 length:486 start_codon:yes stop_codon:yes gene_type:complete
MKWITGTFTYWYDLYRDIRMWWIFKNTAKENVKMLNEDHGLRVDWLGRIYGIVNLPEEVQSASLDVQQAYVLQQITKYGDCMLKIGLADVVYPQIQKIKQSSSFLIVLWPVFDDLSLLPILGNIIKTTLVCFIVFIIGKFSYHNVDIIVNLWEKLATWIKS